MRKNLRTIQQRRPVFGLEPIMFLPPLGAQPHHAGLAHIHERSLYCPLEAICLTRDLGRVRRLVREQVERTLTPNIYTEEGAELEGKIGRLRGAEFL